MRVCFPFGTFCFVLFCLVPRLVSFGGIGSNYVGLFINELDLCRVHKDSLCMITAHDDRHDGRGFNQNPP